jgi:tetratricopeptide (TPR) repeat protein
MRGRNAGIAGGCKGGRNAGDDFERNLVQGEAVELLGSAGKDHGVAAFEAHDRRIELGQGNQPLVDLGLRNDAAGAVLAEGDAQAIGPAVAENGRVDEVVVEDGVGPLEDFDRAERDQAWIARPGANEINTTSCHCYQNNSMPGNSPTPTLINPDLRRRLQQRYEEAVRLSGRALPDYHQIHVLLSDCLRADPGNILYLDAVLANLRKRDAGARGESWFSKWFSRRKPAAAGASQAAASAGNQPDSGIQSAQWSVLTGAPEALWNSSADASLFRDLAIAAGECDLEEVEERYWQAAAEAAPGDVEIARGRARALSRRGKFGEAAAAWLRVQSLRSGDAEATAALGEMLPTGNPSGDVTAQRQAWEKEPHSVVAGLRLAEALIRGSQFDEADRVLADVQSAAGGDLRVLEERENLQLARSEHRLAIARQRAASDLHPKAESLVARLEDEHHRLEIDIFNLRAERLPRDWSMRLELARRLKRSGNFSGAVQRLAEALALRRDEPKVLIEMGECWQHLRQFVRALEFYEKAKTAAEMMEPGGEAYKLASYRAAVLAAAMGQREFAREHFRMVVSADAHFKDARQRLDKLEAN